MRNAALSRCLVVLGLPACLLAFGSSARASEVAISVLGLEPAAGAPDAVAGAIAEALRQRITTTAGYRLVPGRDLVEVKLVFSCPDEAPGCMTQAAQSLGANKLIFGNLQPVGTDAYLVTLKLLDADKGVVEGWTSEQITKAQASPVALRAPAQKWFAALTGQAAPGSIKIAGGVVGANVWLDGAQAGVLGADGLTLAGVASGNHDIVVSKAGYEKFERRVTVAPGASERVAVELKSIAAPGGAEAASEELPIAKTEALPPTETPNQGARIAAWALLGAGMVGIALGAYSGYEVTVVNSNLDPYRRYPCIVGGPPTCASDGKKNPGALTPEERSYVDQQKNSGDNYSKLQWVGYGVGGALLVTSAVFFYRGYFAKPAATASKRRSDFIVMPSVGPYGAGALAYLRW